MTNSKKTTPIEPVHVVPESPRYKGWDMSRIFWGLTLVLIGALILLDNLGIVEAHYQNLWQLWPLLIVGWGVSLLNIKGTWWNVVSVLLMLASLGLLVWTAVGTGPFQETATTTQSQRVEKTDPTIDRLDVSVEAGAGKVTIGSGHGNTPVDATLRSGFAGLDIDTRTEGTTQKVTVSAESNRRWWTGGFSRDLNVRLSKQLPIDLRVETGASELDVDASNVKLESLDLDLGASSSVVTLGSLTNAISVKLDAGASSVVLRVPKDSGVSVQLDKGVSSQDLDGLQDKGDGLYETDGFNAAAKKITIRGEIGVTSFTLERY